MIKSNKVELSLKKRLLNALEEVRPFVNLRRPVIKINVITKDNIAGVARRVIGESTDIARHHGSIACCSESIKRDAYCVFYNKDVWANASHAVLVGSLAHELVHRELLELNDNWEPPPYLLPGNGNCSVFSESLVDLVVMHKGFKNQTFQWKQYLEDNHIKFIGMNASTASTLIQQEEEIRNDHGQDK